MRKIVSIFVLLVVAVFGNAPPSLALDYTITQITNNDSTDFDPRLNASGQVTWHGMGQEGDADRDIFLYNGSSTIQISINSYWDGYPEINDAGHIVWYGYIVKEDPQIFLYDGSAITQLTDNSYQDRYPQINTSGQIAWQGEVGEADYEIFLFDGTMTTQLTDNAYVDEYPRISENGHVVWEANEGSDSEIFLYNGTTTKRLTDNDYDDEHPQINATGQVVWEGYDGSDTEIFFYNGTTTIQLTDNDYDDEYPQINAGGQVVWHGYDGSDTEVFFYNGITTIQLTDNATLDERPLINASGLVVWLGYDGSDTELFLYDGSDIQQLTNNSYAEFEPTGINDAGQVVWYAHDTVDQEVFLATPGSAGLVASFTAAPLKGNSPLIVSFTDQSSGSPVSWSWDFGDGTTSTEQHPTHTYAELGVYTVSLRIEDAEAGTDTETRTGYIVVTDDQPEPGCDVTLTFDDIVASNGAFVIAEEYAAQGVHFISHPTLPTVTQDGYVYDNAHAPFRSAFSGDQFLIMKTENGYGLVVHFDEPVVCASFQVLVEDAAPVVINAFFQSGDPSSPEGPIEMGATNYVHFGAESGWMQFDSSAATGPFSYLLLVCLEFKNWALDDLAFSSAAMGTGIQIIGTSSDITSNTRVGDTVQFTVDAIARDDAPVNYRFFLRAGYGEPEWGGNKWTIVQEDSEANTVSVPFDTPGVYFLIGQIEYPGEKWEFGDPQAGFPVEVSAGG